MCECAWGGVVFRVRREWVGCVVRSAWGVGGQSVVTLCGRARGGVSWGEAGMWVSRDRSVAVAGDVREEKRGCVCGARRTLIWTRESEGRRGVAIAERRVDSGCRGSEAGRAAVVECAEVNLFRYSSAQLNDGASSEYAAKLSWLASIWSGRVCARYELHGGCWLCKWEV